MVENKPWEKQTDKKNKVWNERHSEASLISFSFTFQCFRESQCKQTRNLFSFPQMSSIEIITQFEKKERKKKRSGLACFKESIQICWHSEWASIYGYCEMRRSLYARKQPSRSTLFWFCVILQPSYQDLSLSIWDADEGPGILRESSR